MQIICILCNCTTKLDSTKKVYVPDSVCVTCVTNSITDSTPVSLWSQELDRTCPVLGLKWHFDRPRCTSRRLGWNDNNLTVDLYPRPDGSAAQGHNQISQMLIDWLCALINAVNVHSGDKRSEFVFFICITSNLILSSTHSGFQLLYLTQPITL